MKDALIVDTGAWLESLEGHDPWAQAVEDATDVIVPSLVLAEVDYFLAKRRSAMHRLLRDIRDGVFRYEACTSEDLFRAHELDAKFKGLGLGLVDASVAALAERLSIYRVLTIDSDLAAVRIGPRYDRALELACPLRDSSLR